jgi:alkanesulfonate monooxygenase SsuD/methylene tetrahydromethanopterin reductase-like flavin-dependent oxidoreductase (luciferase family)
MAAGRDPASIRRAYNLFGQIVGNGETAAPGRRGAISGTVEEVAAEIVRFHRDLRMDTFIYWPVGGEPAEQARRFASEVVPLVRKAIDANAGTRGPA